MFRGLKIMIGYQLSQELSFRVCVASLEKYATQELDIAKLDLDELRRTGVYTRQHVMRDGQLWDTISDAPMSTQFSISRFLTPFLAGFNGWALYVDNDFMFRADVAELFAKADDRHALMVTKPFFEQRGGEKMDHKIQTVYSRKLWSAMMLFNCEHHATKRLVPDYVNSRTGKELHQFGWLHDTDIGQLPGEWAWIDTDPRAVHFTTGTPDLPGYENVPYADEWRKYLL